MKTKEILTIVTASILGFYIYFLVTQGQYLAAVLPFAAFTYVLKDIVR